MSENILEKIIKKKIEKIDKLKKHITIKSLEEKIEQNNSFVNFKDKITNNIINNKNPSEIYFIYLIDVFIMTSKQAPKPTNAKELFNNKDNQSPSPDIVPIIGPNARSIQT